MVNVRVKIWNGRTKYLALRQLIIRLLHTSILGSEGGLHIPGSLRAGMVSEKSFPLSAFSARYACSHSDSPIAPPSHSGRQQRTVAALPRDSLYTKDLIMPYDLIYFITHLGWQSYVVFLRGCRRRFYPSQTHFLMGAIASPANRSRLGGSGVPSEGTSDDTDVTIGVGGEGGP